MPIGAARQSLKLANLVAGPPVEPPVEPPVGVSYQGYVRVRTTTTISSYNTAGVELSTAFTHSVGTVSVIKTARLPGTNNFIVAVVGASGRRVLYLDTSINAFTSIFSSTAITAITGCDIHMNEAEGKFYVAFSSSTTTTTNRLTWVHGNIATPFSAVSTASLPDPGSAAYTVAWNPQGTILALRTSTNIRTYTRSGTTMSLVAGAASLAGGQTGPQEEDLSWSYDGTLLTTSNFNNSSITRYTAASDGVLTILGSTSVVSGSQNFPALNPNPVYGGVMAVGAQTATQIKMIYYNSTDWSPTSVPSTGYLSTSQGAVQMRWSPTGDKLAKISGPTTTHNVQLYNFTYSEGATATSSFSLIQTISLSHPGFDWIYY
jgi:hypothetical protein